MAPRKVPVLGFGIFYIEGRNGGWLRTGSRTVHGIKTYPTLGEAMLAIFTDPRLTHRVGHYQIVPEYAFFCRRGDDCAECLSHEPVPPDSIDWTVVQEKVRV